jgi:hypothetical protein
MLQEENGTDNVKNSFSEKRMLDKSPNYQMKILLGDFNAKVGSEEVLNRQLGMKIYTKLVMILELD